MSIIDDCIKFIEDLILGDFNENQQVSAQIIGGLISLIPVVDQIMDVRDVSGSLFHIYKGGGFAKATIEQKINFGFAAFGVIPEVGSAFKTVFKPLYKERKAAKGAFNGGVAMIERMLGQQKGGAVKWVKALDWANNTDMAITKANLALEACVSLLEYLTEDHWWVPARLQNQARDLVPGLKGMRCQLAAPIKEAAAHIKAFMEDMLGEHATAVAFAVAGNVGSISRNHGPNHSANAAPTSRLKPAGKVDTVRHAPGTPHTKVKAENRESGKTTTSKVASVTQRVAYDTYTALNYAAKGLMGEHITDHHIIEQKGWGLQWNRHDMIGGPGSKGEPGWQSVPKKLNDQEIPLYLCTPSAHVLTSGIDSVWLTNRAQPHQFAIVEAKANMNPAATLHQLLGEAQDKPAGGNSGSGRRKNRAKDGTTAKSSPNQTDKVMQMSHKWIDFRIKRDFATYKNKILGGSGNYSRHVFLVTPLQASEHTIAIGKIMTEGLTSNPSGAQKYAKDHERHDVQKEFGENDLNDAEEKYQAVGVGRQKKKPVKKPKG